MRHPLTLNPSKARAAAHRAMALAAFHADSSLAVRQRRYAEHMACAAELEGSTRDPRTALAWIKAGNSVHIDALNLPDQLRHVRALAALEAVGDAMGKFAASSAVLGMRALLADAGPFAPEAFED